MSLREGSSRSSSVATTGSRPTNSGMRPYFKRSSDGRSRRRLFDEPFGQRLGQCRDGELLLVVEDRAHTGRKTYRTRDEARADVFDYIERFYNPKRRHSTIGYLSPMEFESQAGLA